MSDGFTLLAACLAPTSKSHAWDRNFIDEFALGPEASRLLESYGLFYARIRWRVPHMVERLTASQNLEAQRVTDSGAATSLGMHLNVATTVGDHADDSSAASAASMVELAIQLPALSRSVVGIEDSAHVELQGTFDGPSAELIRGAAAVTCESPDQRAARLRHMMLPSPFPSPPPRPPPIALTPPPSPPPLPRPRPLRPPRPPPTISETLTEANVLARDIAPEDGILLESHVTPDGPAILGHSGTNDVSVTGSSPTWAGVGLPAAGGAAVLVLLLLLLIALFRSWPQASPLLSVATASDDEEDMEEDEEVQSSVRNSRRQRRASSCPSRSRSGQRKASKSMGVDQHHRKQPNH